MKINFTAKHTNISPDIRKYCEKRIKTLEKLLGYSVEADFFLSVEKYRKIVEINIKTKGATLNTVEETQDMFSSLGVALDQLEKRVKKEKEKLRERKRRKNKDMAANAPPLATKEQGPSIIRSRDYSMKPMSAEEAFLLFESGKKEVFLFREFNSDKWSVFYRRKDGNYGLVEQD